MIFFGAVVLALAGYISIFKETFTTTIIPFPHISVPVINISCFVICASLLIKNNIWLQYTVLLVQSINTMCIGMELLSIFMYSTLILLLFCNKFFMTHHTQKRIALLVIWLLISLCVLPFGFYRFCRTLAISFFEFAIYCNVYYKLERLLLPCVSQPTLENLKLPPKGEVIHLSDFGLTERQIKLVMFYLKNNSSYEELGNEFIISKSTVKKEMVAAFSKFNVTNQKDLHILLMQYIVKE